MKNKLVSIVIPTYSRNDSLENAIMSAEKQTYKNIEIIVVDDNSPDSPYRKNNEKLMQRLCMKYNNIKYIKHKENKNGAAARNTGIKQSKGKYIAFLDDDDEFLSDKIEVQYNYLENNQSYKCVGCSYLQNGKKILNNYYGDVSEKILTLQYNFTTSMLMFDKEALLSIGGFDERFIRHQDYELLLKYCKQYEIGKMNKVLLIKGGNDGGNIPLGKKAEDVKILFLESFMPIIETINDNKPGFKRKVLFENYYELFISCVKGHDIKLTIKYGLKAFFKKPISFLAKTTKTSTHILYKKKKEG